MLLIVLTGVGYGTGLFDDIISRYETRGAEDTGRLPVLPVAIERFLRSPLIGVGAAQVASYVEGREHLIAPHNTFIWLALASGIVPLLLFVGWWIQMGRNAIAASGDRDAPFLAPLLAFTFVSSILGDLVVMLPWALIAVCFAMKYGARTSRRRTVLRRASRPRSRVESPALVAPDLPERVG
jgi:O-antigen ligase